MSEQQPKQITRHDFESDLIVRAWKDETFKQELLKNPKSVYTQQLQQQLPDDLEIRVLEETPNTLYLVIPQNSANLQVTEELSDAALESVAGGETVGIVVITVGII